MISLKLSCAVLLALMIATIAFLFPSETIAQSNSPRFIGLRCHMNVCSWMALKEKEIIKENSNGRLIGVTTLDCSTKHPSGNYPKSYACRPNEISEAHFVAFCSTRFPTVGFKNSESNKWIRNRLVISQNGISGVFISSLISYLYACHDVVWSGQNLDFLGARLGYRSSSSDGFGEQDEVDSVLDFIQ